MSTEEREQIETTALNSFSIPRAGFLVLVLAIFVGVLGYAIHEHSLAAQAASENDQTASELKATQAQMDALSAKLDALTTAQQVKAEIAVHHAAVVHARRVAVHHAKPDPRWERFQNQLDAQGKSIDATRLELAGTRTDLQSSIAKNHEGLVALQRKGERNYYEFDINKSKQFSHAGPVGISLRKANTKHRYADLELMVDDNEISKKHLDLYEPAMFYPSDEGQPLELVINSISKNHIHGYISAPKYRASELSASSAPADAASGEVASAPPQLRTRQIPR